MARWGTMHGGMSAKKTALAERAFYEGTSARDMKRLDRLSFEAGQTVRCHREGAPGDVRWIGEVISQRQSTKEYIVLARWLPDGRPMMRATKMTFTVVGRHSGSPGGIPGLCLVLAPMATGVGEESCGAC